MYVWVRVCVCAHIRLLLRAVVVCSVSAVRMKTLSISIQQQLVLTSFCLLLNALQLVSATFFVYSLWADNFTASMLCPVLVLLAFVWKKVKSQCILTLFLAVQYSTCILACLFKMRYTKICDVLFHLISCISLYL